MPCKRTVVEWRAPRGRAVPRQRPRSESAPARCANLIPPTSPDARRTALMGSAMSSPVRTHTESKRFRRQRARRASDRPNLELARGSSASKSMEPSGRTLGAGNGPWKSRFPRYAPDGRTGRGKYHRWRSVPRGRTAPPRHGRADRDSPRKKTPVAQAEFAILPERVEKAKSSPPKARPRDDLHIDKILIESAVIGKMDARDYRPSPPRD